MRISDWSSDVCSSDLRDLELVRHPAAPAHLLQLDAEAGRILRAEAAPFGPAAGFHRAKRLAIGVAGYHAGGVYIGPDGGQVFLVDAEDVAACPTRHLYPPRRAFSHPRIRPAHRPTPSH